MSEVIIRKFNRKKYIVRLENEVSGNCFWN
jgi:hypothetical protein